MGHKSHNSQPQLTSLLALTDQIAVKLTVQSLLVYFALLWCNAVYFQDVTGRSFMKWGQAYDILCCYIFMCLFDLAMQAVIINY